MRDAVASLTEKYQRLVALRRAPPSAEPPTEAMRALAARWPGALRELDRLPIEALEARLAALAAADPEAPPRWVLRDDAWHRTMAAALRARALLRGARHPDPARCEAIAKALDPDAPDPAFVSAVAAPPAGRLGWVVAAALAPRFGVSPEALWQEVAPSHDPARRERVAGRASRT